MLFDTHCHLNFEAFEGRVKKVIDDAKKVGVDQIVIPGTDIATSEKAVSIAEKYEGTYAAVGIHPHHVFEIFKAQISVFSTASPQRGPRRLSQKQQSSLTSETAKNLISSLSKLLSHSKVVAIGEVGIDRHIYQKTKHQDYKMNQEFVELQKIILKEQIKLAIKYDKSLILHNREAREDMFEVLQEVWDKRLEGRTVFHCCEPDPVGTIHELSLLEFAKNHKMFIGVDGDITYYEDKQQFIKEIPLDMLVLETDSPFLSPTKQFPNEPKNIPLIAEFVAKLKGISVDEVAETTTENAKKLFQL